MKESEEWVDEIIDLAILCGNRVNHPSHYNKGIETIDYIESWNMDFNIGNVIQGCLFGIMHIILFLLAGINVGVIGYILVFLSTGVPALILTYLNEKLFNKSIIPSILVHGLGNFISYMMSAF